MRETINVSRMIHRSVIIILGDITMNLREFGIYFAGIREKSGYRSQRELADKSGVSHSTINRIEAGSHKTKPETLKALAPFLKEVGYEELLEKSGILDGEKGTSTFDKKDFAQDENDPNMGLAFITGGEDLTEEEAEYLKESLELFRRMRERKSKDREQK